MGLERPGLWSQWKVVLESDKVDDCMCLLLTSVSLSLAVSLSPSLPKPPCHLRFNGIITFTDAFYSAILKKQKHLIITSRFPSALPSTPTLG